MQLNPRTIFAVLLGLTFVWPGLDKFNQPGYWVMWLPAILDPLKPVYGESLVYAIAIFEIIIGFGLLITSLRRYAAIAASVFLGLILATSGVNAVTFRDLGLLGGTIYVAATGPSVRLTPLKVKPTKTLVIALLAVLGLLVASILPATVNAPVSSSGPTISDGDGRVAVFLTPTEGQTVLKGNVELKFRLLVDAKKLGLNHVHVRLDGKVLDAIYLVASGGEITVMLRAVEAGQHTVTVSLAYLDHTEPSGMSATLRFVVAG